MCSDIIFNDFDNSSLSIKFLFSMRFSVVIEELVSIYAPQRIDIWFRRGDEIHLYPHVPGWLSGSD